MHVQEYTTLKVIYSILYPRVKVVSVISLSEDN